MSALQYAEQFVDIWYACLPRARPERAQAASACLIAHRGAHDQALGIQENTMSAFERALQLGCFGIELDVHASADGVLVVNHDPDLKRLWGNSSVIAETSFKSLRAIAPSLPSLKDVVKIYGKTMHLFIELKSEPNDERLKRDLYTLVPGQDYHLISLKECYFKPLTAFPSDALLLVATALNTARFCKISQQKPYGGVLGHYLLMSRRRVRALKAAGQSVGVGFVDSKFVLYRALKRGLHYVFTDNAALVSGELDRLLSED